VQFAQAFVFAKGYNKHAALQIHRAKTQPRGVYGKNKKPERTSGLFAYAIFGSTPLAKAGFIQLRLVLENPNAYNANTSSRQFALYPGFRML
jgi:hypothetical protein